MVKGSGDDETVFHPYKSLAPNGQEPWKGSAIRMARPGRVVMPCIKLLATKHSCIALNQEIFELFGC